MKVLFISRAYRDNAGGMERLSYELINELRKLPAIEATVIGYGGPRLFFPMYFALNLPRILWLVRKTELVHLGDPVLSGIGWLLQRLWNKPIAVTVHGLDVAYPTRLFHWYLQLFFRTFDLYLPISNHAAKLLTPWHVSGNVKVIAPGISDRFYDPSITQAQLDAIVQQKTSGRLVLLTVGRLIKRKGHEWFIREVLPQLPPTTLYIIAGSGPEEKNILQVAADLRLSDQVVQLGRVSDAQLKIIYNAVDAFVQPNVSIPGDAEGFGLVLLEAALCKRAVYASNIDGIPDAIISGKNGTLLPVGDADAWVIALTAPVIPITTARSFTLATYSWNQQAARVASALATNVVKPSAEDAEPK